ncbi:VWFA domain-containing protein [Entamoeba marina]
MKVLFAVDASGSTSGSDLYWNRVISFRTKKLQKKELYDNAKNRSGNCGGTDVYLVANHVQTKDFHGKLVLITDGEVWDVPRAEEIMKKHTGFTMVVCHIINYGSHNLSVSCPFTRGINSFVYTHTEQERKLVIEVTEAVKNTVLGLDKMSVDEFIDNYKVIEGYIVSQNMGRSGNDELRNLLLNNKNRLLYEFGKKNKGSFENRLLNAIGQKDIQDGIAIMKEFTDEYYKKMNDKESGELTFEEKLQHLIDLCGDAIQNQFDMQQIRSSRAKRAKKVEQVNVEQVEETAVEEAMSEGVKMLMECPLSGEEDVGVLLLTGENVLDGIPKNVTNDIINCPFRILNYPEIVNRIKNSLGGVVGINSIRQNQMKESPLNGNPIIGGIVFSNQKDMIKIVNSSISKLFTREKLLGSPLYYLVAIYSILKGEEDYSSLLDGLKQIIVARLKTSHTFAALTGKSEYVTTLLRTDVALWYIVHSCFLELPPPNDPMVLHLSDIDTIVELLHLLEYTIDEKALHHIDCLKAMYTLHHMKFINSDVAEVLIRALYQKAIYLDKKNIRDKVCKTEYYLPFVFVDGKADEDQIQHVLSLINPIFKKLSIEEIIAINALVHARFRLSGTVVPMTLQSPVIECESNWEGLKCGETTIDIEKMKKKFHKKYGFEANKEEFYLYLYRRLRTRTLPSI